MTRHRAAALSWLEMLGTAHRVRALFHQSRTPSGMRLSNRRLAGPLDNFDSVWRAAYLFGWDSDCHIMSPWPFLTRHPGPSASAVGLCSTRRLVFHRASLGPEPASRPLRPAS
jgi:hypothetical protein